MGQVSSKLRRGEGRYFHWCPACQEMHPLPDSWTFDGDLESPTSFTPSFRQGPSRRFGAYDARGVGIGEPYEWVCHYILTAGVLHFCSDCTHALAGQNVPLPELPLGVQDGDL